MCCRSDPWVGSGVRRAVKRLEVLHNFINNKFVASHSAATFDLVSPVDETVVGMSPLSDAADVDRAVEAAAEVFTTWNKTTPASR